MKKPSYKKLHDIILNESMLTIDEFANTNDNKDVYALTFDTNEHYGTIILSINTIDGLNRRIESTYQDYNNDQINGLDGVKYNSGDFSFIDICRFSSELDDWSDLYNNYLEDLKSEKSYFNNIEKFSDTIVSVIFDLNQTIQKLNTASGFIAYHCFHDVDSETSERLIRKTVSNDLFDRVFPEVRQYDEFIRNIDSLNTSEIIEVWLNMLTAYIKKSSQIFSSQFYKNKIYLDVEPELIKIGEPGLGNIFQYLDEIIFEKQLNEKGSAQWYEDGAFTRESNVCSLLLDVIIGICYIDNNIEHKLLNYIHRLQEEAGKVDGTIGLNLCLSARCLHSLLPKKYPKDHMCPSSNRLLNYQSYEKNT